MINIYKCENDDPSCGILIVHIKKIQVYINTSIISWPLGTYCLSLLKNDNPYEFKASESFCHMLFCDHIWSLKV